jgi:hypothetical protein
MSGYDLVTLAQARAQLRSTSTADDTDLSLKISAASRAVVQYLDGGGSAFLNSSGQPDTNSAGHPLDVPEDVQLATLMLIAEYYKNREGAQDGAIDMQFGYAYLPRPVIALLYPLRTPVIG